MKSFLFPTLPDLMKLYNHPELDPDLGPQQLQNKVQLDIRYYFCRRGGENVHDFKKDTFTLMFDNESKIAYVKKTRDELTKNHRENDTEMVTGFMPQLLDMNGHPHRLCPVRSFENLLSHLNPKIDSLWQQPMKKVNTQTQNIWFKAIPLGHNPLDTFMGKLSETCNLSQHYTNHCIRVTGITNLLHTGKYTAKQVMSVTGHKSIQSLAIYQRVKDDEKMMMGMSLTYSLLHPEEIYPIKLAQLEAERQNQFQPVAAQAQLSAPQHVLPIQLPQVPLQQFNAPVQGNANFNQPLAPVSQNHLSLHAVDPSNKDVPLENALVPFKPRQNQKENSTLQPAADVDFLDLLCDMEDDDENRALTLAAEQVEAQMYGKNTTTTHTTALMTQKKPTVTTFTGCTFGNIGTLNIHIHKNN